MIWNPSSGVSSRLRDADQGGGDLLAGDARLAICGAQHAGRRHGLRHGFGEQLLLRAEVAVDQHRRDPGAARDFAHAGPGVTRLGEGPTRRVQDRLTGGCCVALPPGGLGLGHPGSSSGIHL